MKERVGAYGLCVVEPPERMRSLLGAAPPDWPRLELLSVESDGGDDPNATFTAARARIPLPDGGEIVVTSSPLVAEVRMPSRPLEAELLHPYLGYVAVVAARWFGRDCVHAGAFVVDGGAFAVVGARGTGKSSLLGWLSQRGHDVVCDDVLVIREGVVLAGPRFVDLRAEAADRLGAGDPIGMVGARERWRLPLAPIAPELPLRGWLFLEWGDEIGVERIAAGDAIMRIQEQLSVFVTPREPAALLDLASYPAWRVRRPRGWNSIAATVDELLSAARRV